MASQYRFQERWKGLKRGKQACDCCRGRKIRCDSNQPCSNCQRTEQPCSYRVPKKKGPRKKEVWQAESQAVEKNWLSRMNKRIPGMLKRQFSERTCRKRTLLEGIHLEKITIQSTSFDH
ncbi:Maltose fermentation regulatory MAL63 [Hyphodiscus hymeniophilus]|uniref:Maltose fermentation regulatory MAL63 n=1 Tax=Hyphodiscus hymeniophilus TaxID=353542 RepID=A0A9P6VDN0_9HELO|nr:Maltose fermentation regulatory MAL63 [Hyphodiscus hymeniophilus]